MAVKDIARSSDVISGAVLGALGVYVFMQSQAWDYYTADGPGPGFFPAWYGASMVALSLLLIWNALRNDNSERAAVDWPSTGRALTTWFAFAVSVALMEPLGFLVSFALLTFFIVAVMFRRPVITAGITAVVTTLAFHVVFPVLLNVPLPIGLLGF
jgi:putative tricarboxylic transport membrane protein